MKGGRGEGGAEMIKREGNLWKTDVNERGIPEREYGRGEKLIGVRG